MLQRAHIYVDPTSLHAVHVHHFTRKMPSADTLFLVSSSRIIVLTTLFGAIGPVFVARDAILSVTSRTRRISSIKIIQTIWGQNPLSCGDTTGSTHDWSNICHVKSDLSLLHRNTGPHVSYEHCLWLLMMSTLMTFSVKLRKLWL